MQLFFVNVAFMHSFVPCTPKNKGCTFLAFLRQVDRPFFPRHFILLMILLSIIQDSLCGTQGKGHLNSSLRCPENGGHALSTVLFSLLSLNLVGQISLSY